MAHSIAKRPNTPADPVLVGVGALVVVAGLVLAAVHWPDGGFLFLPLDLLTLLTVAGGALLLTAGLVGNTEHDSAVVTLWTVLVVVASLVATIVVLSLHIF